MIVQFILKRKLILFNFLKQKQNLLVVRHGERVDITFGHEWVAKAFDANGTK